MKTKRYEGCLVQAEKSPKSSYFTLRAGNVRANGFMTRFVALEWVLSQLIALGASDAEQTRIISLFDRELDCRLRASTIATI